MAVIPSPRVPIAGGRDWRDAERSSEFAALIRERRRFLLPALVAVALFYGGFVVMAAFGRDALAATIAEPFTVGEVWALSQIPFAWIVALLYMRRCTREIDPLAERVRLTSATTPDVARDLEPVLP